MKVINPSSLPLRRTLPLGLEGLLAIVLSLGPGTADWYLEC
ncbi:hypothetical protein [Streptomyces sp. NBC_00500]